jgi:hypothetical protein
MGFGIMSAIAEGSNMLRDIMAKLAPKFFRRRKLVPLFGEFLSTKDQITDIIAERWPSLSDSWREATLGWKPLSSAGQWLKAHFPDEDWGPMGIPAAPRALREYRGRVEFSETDDGR